MKKRALLLVIVLFVGFTAFAQQLELENTWKKESKVVYVGVENRFLIRGNAKLINSIRTENASSRIAGDTIIIVPKNAGQLNIELYTNQGSVLFTYRMENLPALRLDFLHHYHITAFTN